MITFQSSGSFKRTDSFLAEMLKPSISKILEKYGQQGVNALSAATPVLTGQTAAAWDYEVIVSRGSASIVWTNSHQEGGKPIAILIQYGHGTGTGGYVPGTDYINPAMKPILDKIADDAWREVTNA